MSKMYDAASVIRCMMENPNDTTYRYTVGVEKLKKGGTRFYVERRGVFDSAIRSWRGKSVENQGTRLQDSQARDKVRANNFLLARALEAMLAKSEDQTIKAHFASKSSKDRLTSAKSEVRYFENNFPGKVPSKALKNIESMVRYFRAGAKPSFETQVGVEKASALLFPEEFEFAVGQDNSDNISFGSNTSLARAHLNPKDIFLGNMEDIDLATTDEVVNLEFAKSAQDQLQIETNSITLKAAKVDLFDGSPAKLVEQTSDVVNKIAAHEVYLKQTVISEDARQTASTNLHKFIAEINGVCTAFTKDICAQIGRRHAKNFEGKIAGIKAAIEQFEIAIKDLRAQKAVLEKNVLVSSEDQKQLWRLTHMISFFGKVTNGLGQVLQTEQTEAALAAANELATIATINPFYGIIKNTARQNELCTYLQDTITGRDLGPVLQAIETITEEAATTVAERGSQVALITKFGEKLIRPKEEVKQMGFDAIAHYLTAQLSPQLQILRNEYAALNQRLLNYFTQNTGFDTMTMPGTYANGDDAHFGLLLIDGADSKLVPSGIQEDGTFVVPNLDGETCSVYQIPASMIKRSMMLYRLREQLISAEQDAKNTYFTRLQLVLSPTSAPKVYEKRAAYAQLVARHEYQLYPTMVAKALLPVPTKTADLELETALANTSVATLGAEQDESVSDLVDNHQLVKASGEEVNADFANRIDLYSQHVINLFTNKFSSTERATERANEITKLKGEVRTYQNKMETARKALDEFDKERSGVGAGLQINRTDFDNSKQQLQVNFRTYAVALEIAQKVLSLVSVSKAAPKKGRVESATKLSPATAKPVVIPPAPSYAPPPPKGSPSDDTDGFGVKKPTTIFTQEVEEIYDTTVS